MEYDRRIDRALNRDPVRKRIQQIIYENEITTENGARKSIFLYGRSGIGKTSFIKDILREMDYDMIYYGAGDIRNKYMFDQIIKNTICSSNVMHMFHKITKRIVVVMDEVEGMNNGDRGGLNSLIRLIKPDTSARKKRRQKDPSADATNTLDATFKSTIICICNHNIDKKIAEVMKLCTPIYIPDPTPSQMIDIARLHFGAEALKCEVTQEVVSSCQHDVRKLLMNADILQCMCKHNAPTLYNYKVIRDNVCYNNFNIKIKQVIYNLIRLGVDATNINAMMFSNETNRAMISLIWYENIIDYLAKDDPEALNSLYHGVLTNMCIGDYIDRITFQKQIWQLNEMTSLIKIIYNSLIVQPHLDVNQVNAATISSIRFTKVLTKYSSEYNNYNFLCSMCERIAIDRQNLIRLVSHATNLHNGNVSGVVEEFTKKYDISSIETKRLFKYVNKVESVRKNTHIKPQSIQSNCMHSDVFAEDYTEPDWEHDADVESTDACDVA